MYSKKTLITYQNGTKKTRGRAISNSETTVDVLAVDAVSQVLDLFHGRVHHVEQNGEDGTSRVYSERDPPQQLLVQLLLEVFEHQEADCEAG